MSRWQLRTVPDELRREYLERGWWNDASLGDVVAGGLSRMRAVPFRVHSQTRPWSGTFADVDRAARSLATTWASKGIGPGDVVAFQLPNWVESAITFWAAAYLGAVVVPIVHFYGTKEVRYILQATRPDAVVTTDRFGRSDYLAAYDDLLAAAGSPHWLVVESGAPGSLPASAVRFETALQSEPLREIPRIEPDAPAVVAFTSGTTRDPKGVVHSHRTIGCEARQLDYMFPDIGPPPITGAPVGHFIGMVNAFLVPLLRAMPVTLVDVWDPVRILQLMSEHGYGMAGGATYFLTSLLDHPDFTDEHLTLMPFAGLGGSPVPVAVTERATRLGIKVYRSYGSTEHPSITGSLLTEPVDKRCTTDGHALPGVEVRLSGAGEIFSRGPDCCVGYTSPELTATAFDADGWYRTGDVGILDDDGYLTITDRLSDVIIRGGENVSAQEVEDELLRGNDTIAEVCVIGAPDDRYGERVVAVVRLRPGATLPDLAAVQDRLRSAGLARPKWPEQLYAVGEFPRTASGKVQKFRLRDELRAGRVPGTGP